ncbi:MAG: chemotaxis protein CheW [Gemmatimonadota bacterium]
MSISQFEQTNEIQSQPARFRDRVRSRRGKADLFMFVVGDERFAFDVRAVEEVLDNPTLFAVPGMEEGVAGVCSHAGIPLPVVEAAAVLGVAAAESETVLVMRREGERLGVLVDDVEDVESIDLDSLRQPPFDEEDDLLIAVLWRQNKLTSILDARAVVSAGAALVSGV